jgi:WbqC-like protein family.
VLLSTAYFPPVAWFALLARDMTLSPDRVSPSTVFLEACENYQKQSYRNRCYILAGDGVQMLQFPVVHAESMRITEVRVDYATPWLVRTKRSLDAAYYTSAYYEYYRDELFEVMDRRPDLLWDWNLALMKFLLEKTGVACRLAPTSSFVAPADAGPDDFRTAIHPKHPDAVLSSLGLDRPYYQVFSDRFGFTPDLSVLDLLFNEGPDSVLWLKKQDHFADKGI